MKGFLWVLLAVGVALYVPESRAVVLDALAPAIDPVLGWSTKGEMRAIARGLERDMRTGRATPARPRDFNRWLERNYDAEEARTDPWGNRYELRLWRDSLGIVSPGPDGEIHSDDDLVVTLPAERRR